MDIAWDRREESRKSEKVRGKTKFPDESRKLWDECGNSWWRSLGLETEL